MHHYMRLGTLFLFITFATNILTIMRTKSFFVLFMTIALLFGCQRSELSFLQALDIHADSLIMDSIPQPFSDKNHGLLLSGEQVYQLKGSTIDTFPDILLSIQRFANDYALAFTHCGNVELYLFNPQGKRLDKLDLGYWDAEEKHIPGKPNVIKAGIRRDSLENPLGHYQRLDATHFEVFCIAKTDTIRWQYEVRNHRFYLQKRIANHVIATPSRDIDAYPWSQTYEACSLINGYKEIRPKHIICELKSPAGRFAYEMLRRNHDMGAYWQWIYDHRGHEILSAQIEDIYYWAQHCKDEKQQLPRKMIEEDIHKVKSNSARSYLLRLVRTWNNNPYKDL